MSIQLDPGGSFEGFFHDSYEAVQLANNWKVHLDFAPLDEPI